MPGRGPTRSSLLGGALLIALPMVGAGGNPLAGFLFIAPALLLLTFISLGCYPGEAMLERLAGRHQGRPRRQAASLRSRPIAVLLAAGSKCSNSPWLRGRHPGESRRKEATGGASRPQGKEEMKRKICFGALIAGALVLIASPAQAHVACIPTPSQLGHLRRWTCGFPTKWRTRIRPRSPCSFRRDSSTHRLATCPAGRPRSRRQSYQAGQD